MGKEGNSRPPFGHVSIVSDSVELTECERVHTSLANRLDARPSDARRTKGGGCQARVDDQGEAVATNPTGHPVPANDTDADIPVALDTIHHAAPYFVEISVLLPDVRF
jgi:hypothetical protein